MRDAFVVRRGKRGEDLPCEQERSIERQRPGEWVAVHHLHDQVVRADVVERADVRAPEGFH
jgi:hypothetical protein